MRRITGAICLRAGLVALLLCALPLIAAAAEWQGYLYEDFSEVESMFYSGQSGEAFYSLDADGRYVVDGMESTQESLSALTDNLYYYYLETECEVLESRAGDLAFCGLVFHYNKRVEGKLSYYVFYLYGDGYYGAKRIVGDQVDIIIPLTRSEMIERSRPNVLAVDAQGTRFDLYINGRYVDGFTDVRVDGGGFGFYISKQTRAAFDNFEVKVEKRSGGPSVNVPPLPGEGGAEGDGSGDGGQYVFPDVPVNPNRPLYPWEVGVDKSGKENKGQPEDEPQEEPQDEPEDAPAEGPNEVEDSDSGEGWPTDSNDAPPLRNSDGEADPDTAQDVLLLEPAELEDLLSDTVEDMGSEYGPDEPETRVIDLEEDLVPLVQEDSTPIDASPPPATAGSELTLPPIDNARPVTAEERLASMLSGNAGAVEISDDFGQEKWPVSSSGSSIYRYFGAAYEVDNLNAQTMAISYQQENLRDYSIECDAEFLDGASYVGYGLAARFSVGSAGVSYYGMFISQSGELLLLKVVNGTENVLLNWTASPLINATRVNRVKLVLIGNELSAYINGELAAVVNDSELTSGGYALMAGPGVYARYDNLLIRGLR